MDGTILSQGSYIYDGNAPLLIQIPSGTDWMRVVNYTNASNAGGAGVGYGFEYYWQYGMPAGTGLVKYYGNGTAIVSGDTLLIGGFTLFDSSGLVAGALPQVGISIPTTASTNATRPVVSTASTGVLQVGSVVRLSNTAQNDVNGVDFVVGAVTTNTNFTLLTATNPLANAPGAIGGAGFWRQVNIAPLFYPRARYVVNITRAAFPVVSTSVAHALTPGQVVRFKIPTLTIGNPGMVQLDGVSATVVAKTDDYNFVIDVNTSTFNAFVWPTIAQQPSSFPQMNPVGENTAFALSSPLSQTPTVGGNQINGTQSGILADSTVNTGARGMLLGGGGSGAIAGLPIFGPAGSTVGDTMYWVAGKSTLGGQ